MIRALGLLLACQLAGEAITRAAGLPVPGPVVGLVLLAVGLAAAARLGRANLDTLESTHLGQVAGVLLASLGLLFVPAGVGVVQQANLLGQHGVALAVALIGSTAITLVVTVLVFRAVARVVGRDR
jgi:putative effector of murein hydrolase LrgA (UPF0299 family)